LSLPNLQALVANPWTGDALTDPARAAIVPAANMHASGARQS
jgi:hypothetical protein